MATAAANSGIYDVVIIGGGPGGYVAAIRAAQLGMRTALVEGQHLGGVCLNWGCIPTKALLKSAHLLDQAHKMLEFGVDAGQVHTNLQTMVKRSRAIAQTLGGGIKGLLAKNRVDVVTGWACLQDRTDGVWSVPVRPHLAEAALSSQRLQGEQDAASGEELLLHARHVILATGARARMLFQDVPGIWSAKEAMVPERLPQKLLIIGAGAIGLEFASFYQALGTEVTVVEMSPRILAQEDADISAAALKAFQAKGIQFALDSTISQLTCQACLDEPVAAQELQGSGSTATAACAPENFAQHVSTVRMAETNTHVPSAPHTGSAGLSSFYHARIRSQNGQEQDWQGDQVLVAIGVIGNTEGLGLEHTQARVERGHIVTHHAGCTDHEGLYAIGDVAGAPWLAHKASHEGVTCVEAIAGHSVHTLDPTRIPGCVYTSPQIASIGLTEQAAQAQGLAVRIGRFPLMANGQALANGDTTGFVKVLFDADTGELVGAHMIGAGVSELISTFAVAKTLEATQDDLTSVIFPHPTVSEALHESVLDSQDRALHIPPRTA